MSKKKKEFFKKNKAERRNDSPVKAKKHLGQHFLTDEAIAQQIAETLTHKGYTNVIEIGPGTGVLTKYILKHNLNLIAMDLDTESIAYLNQNFLLEHPELLTRKGTFKVVEADFLKQDLTTIFGDEQFAISGNFPYNISTQIVFKTLEHKEQIPEFTGMFQKEVAERICSKEGSKAYGILSVLAQAYYHAEYLFTVPPTVFNPPPKVDSGVLRLTRKENLDIGVDEKLLYRVVKAVFNQRRKTIRNSLKTFELSDNLKEDPIFGKRPEQLAVADFVALTKKIANDTV
ncbi:MAG: 16S rRNA (adenine(1518)-N(6)/adenine(1519)-N(6))-dimethyltransferase RsmA [Cellulophaga sp.]|uniref:16S rRNA (adenine(1518)-N(6)/adenine(1519)-N(6))- dimethyltransferase RsmA n=1 Tax=unclassified Cellulophaga TaxID=2634405 RepID=UPI0026E42F7E|nr:MULTISPECIES: 16S rRNA (adenine(1518)-N(6)/adenine(1519)-N(6))-dimethyltransferase RsmA [unclassified Cellulophaga]MDO6490151.1 16S rRNA (adenine(1518)-N(6)/adenine(1519)-N(6))-dimethyltransferase RsmA [Cellulophaga sp. 2_MG-2023]MDO6494655.1 16S rRNA (adenine(1518)-N(6)/adenine(1519)-N(6))-dimethyltransferase RsmA [Cellulophaga sp. 3_MG-2023]